MIKGLLKAHEELKSKPHHEGLRLMHNLNMQILKERSSLKEASSTKSR